MRLMETLKHTIDTRQLSRANNISPVAQTLSNPTVINTSEMTVLTIIKVAMGISKHVTEHLQQVIPM